MMPFACYFCIFINVGLKEIPGRLLGVQRFTTSGTYTPSPGVKKIIVEVLGGGGGGGGAQAGAGFASFGAGGAAGSYAKGVFTDLLDSYLVTIGAGGKGGGGTENGSPGGTSSLGSLISASGGNPGQTIAAGTGPFIMGSLGTSGTVTGGNVISNPSQNTGGFGFRLSASVCSGGTGSDSIYGRGGDAASSTNRAGRNATGHGAGGGGARAVNQTGTPYKGGDGSDGIVIILEFA
ncbi:phage tail protein [Escherichia coli]|uniref:glycine-rich domain-containing protein n=1 Tax=Escherichia coli TaxID=562 RepID=UPI00226E8531|nr:phage tail protein [Escherichia coli]MCX9322018.1 phage tail protein [Escherichia coli]